MRPGVAPLSGRSPRVVAARRLHRRRERDGTGLFLAEGPQAVREAAGHIVELFGTAEALAAHPGVVADAGAARISTVAPAALEALAETVNPQGLVAVCRQFHVPLDDALGRRPALLAVLVEVRDPGNAGTVLRTADAAGAGAVVFAGDTVDPYNGKAVRASAGSLFHLDVVRARDPLAVVAALRAAGYTVLAADGYGSVALDDAPLDPGGEPQPRGRRGGVPVRWGEGVQSATHRGAPRVTVIRSFTRPAGSGGRRG